MENLYYQFTVPVFINSLTALKGVLAKGEAFAKENGKTDAEMLALKLAPDMFPLVKQVQIACDNAKGASSRLSGKEAPKMEDNEATLSELMTRIDNTIAYLNTITESDFANAKSVTFKMAYFPEDMHFVGESYARLYALPNFFFHLVTAYDILRNAGVQIGKTDYAGNLPLVKD